MLEALFLLPLPMILNRWRGTGGIFSISKFKVTGANIYAVYLGLLFGLITQSYIVGVITTIGFRVGESFGWGKWVGSLCYPERYTEQTKLNSEYLDKEGYNFPYIHYIANAIVPESRSYMGYCRMALGVRGAIWAIFLYAGLVGLDYIEWYDYLAVILVYGIGFPLACYIANLPALGGEYEKIYQNKFIAITGKWEKQEMVYGAIHGLCNMYLVYTIIY